MRLLILALNYAPEPIGVGKYTGELGAWLASHGHEIQVIAAPPFYPAWRLAADGDAWRYRRETIAGATVWRCPVWVPGRPGTLGRVLLLLSFAVSSLPLALWLALRWRPQVVWTVEPTIAGAPGAWLAARLAGARAALHVQDLEVEAGLRLGFVSSRWMGRLLHRAYGALVRRFDLVSTISERMRARLREAGVAETRLCLFCNWVDTNLIHPLATPSQLRQELGLAEDSVVALYAGSMGEKQGLERMDEVARRLVDHGNVAVVMCGDGPNRERLQQLLGGCPNVRFLPLQPGERLNQLLNLADIHLLPQRPGNDHFALPSKLGGMLASGRPVVAQSSAEDEVARTAALCGLAVPSDDPREMAEAILALAADAERRRALGDVARQIAETYFQRDLVLSGYEARLCEAQAEFQPAPESLLERSDEPGR